jgi:FAD/FMN-containing dehydrogenase
MDTVPDRRTFLRAVAAVAGAGLLEGCTRGGVPPPPTPTGTTPGAPTGTRPTGSPTTPGSGPPTAADWTALGRGLDGRLVRPGDRDYDTARLLYSPRYDRIRPAAVAYCAGSADVRECLAFAARHRVPVTARSGGHGYTGASTGPGLVLDVTPLHAVTVDAASGTATVGAGARLIDVYAALAGHGLTVPAGSCPPVGVAGLALGGGVGVVSRAYGLTSDAIVGARMVTADGRVRDCGPDRDPDLFWATRGGGGGNVGVVTSFRFRTFPAPDLTLFSVRWSWSRAARVVDGWQRWAPSAPDPVWSTCKLLAGGGRSTPTVFAAGTFLGSEAGLRRLLDGLVARVGADPVATSVRTLPYLEAMLAEAGCAGLTPDQCHLPWQAPGGRLARESLAAASHFIGRPVPAAGLAAIVRGVAARGALGGGGEGGISLDALGGAVNRVAPADTAFVHRDAIALAQLTTTWTGAAGAAQVAAQQRWLTGFRDALAPYGNGEAYQNYLDPTLAGWQRAYYGRNYDRLVRVKAAYDPGGLLRAPQGIPVA